MLDITFMLLASSQFICGYPYNCIICNIYILSILRTHVRRDYFSQHGDRWARLTNENATYVVLYYIKYECIFLYVYEIYGK